MKRVAIIGAGASGLFCAIQLAYLGCEVEIFERNAKPGLKILVSGGGRCNFTNLGASHLNYLSNNPHFCRSALSRYTSHDFLAWFESFGLNHVDKKPGQLFCSDGAKRLVDTIVEHALSCGVKLHVNAEISDIERSETEFVVLSNRGDFTFDAVVIASGGLSWPKLGVSGFGYQIAKKFGHRVTPLSPGLVPLLWNESQQHLTSLSGISLNVKIKCQDVTFEDDLLFTHQGLSGPVILQISNYWKRDMNLEINCFANEDPMALFENYQKQHPEAQMSSFFEQYLPKRLVKQLLPSDLPQKIKSFAPNDLATAITAFTQWQLTPLDHAGFGKAEVTLGGVDTEKVSSKTLESQLLSGLYFIGEVLDVTGQLGGYNFQWAWSSAWAAAQAIGQDL
jgi:predicted Rossmann fold flavoprotein